MKQMMAQKRRQFGEIGTTKYGDVHVSTLISEWSGQKLLRELIVLLLLLLCTDIDCQFLKID